MRTTTTAAPNVEIDHLELRKHVRPKRCGNATDDPHAIYAGDYLSLAELEEYGKYKAQVTWGQYFVMQQIRFSLLLRHSFINGTVRRGLTVMAVYALLCEFGHDMHHVIHLPHAVEGFLSMFHTKVGRRCVEVEGSRTRTSGGGQVRRSLFRCKLTAPQHAVGIIAVSHLAEHYKESLENQEKPRYSLEEKNRSEFIR